MKTTNRLSFILLSALIAISCSEQQPDQADIVNDLFLKEQNELREAVNTIVVDAETANLEGLKAIHLVSDKFTKFGPRNFERQGIEKTNNSEVAFFGTVSNYKEEVKDLKVDVFGEVGIATYYRHVTFEQDGKENTVDLRQTLAFVKTSDGWKIVHEHASKP